MGRASSEVPGKESIRIESTCWHPALIPLAGRVIRVGSRSCARSAVGCGKADDGGDMPPKLSAGILLYRITEQGAVEVLIAHMGGPFWQRRDAGAWSIPKGEHMAGEDALQAARREFQEELGIPVPASDFL